MKYVLTNNNKAVVRFTSGRPRVEAASEAFESMAGKIGVALSEGMAPKKATVAKTKTVKSVWGCIS